MAKRKDNDIKIQKNFYKNRPWRRKRKEILQRDNFECQQGTVKSQLFEIAIMILVIVFVNFLVLTAFCGDENG